MAVELKSSQEPLGRTELSLKERIVRFIDVHNISLLWLLGLSGALGLGVGVFVGRASVRRRGTVDRPPAGTGEP